MSSLTILVALQTGALEVVHLWRFAGDGACGSCGRRTRGSASKVLVGAGSVSGVHRTGSFHRPFRTFPLRCRCRRITPPRLSIGVGPTPDRMRAERVFACERVFAHPTCYSPHIRTVLSQSILPE